MDAPAPTVERKPCATLLEILAAISARPTHEHRVCAESIEQLRPDLWLYRRILGGKQFSDDLFSHPQKEIAKIFPKILTGLNDKNPAIHSACFALAVRIDFGIANSLVRVGAITPGGLATFIGKLSDRNIIDGLGVGPRERAALRFLSRCTIRNFKDAFRKKVSAPERVTVTIRDLEAEYRNAKSDLREIIGNWKPGEPIRIDAIEDERLYGVEHNHECLVPWAPNDYLLPIGLGIDAIVKGYWNVRDVDQVSGQEATAVLIHARDLAQTAWLVVRQVRVSEETQERNEHVSELDVDLPELKIREQALLGELAALERALFNHARAGIYAVSALNVLGSAAQQMLPKDVEDVNGDHISNRPFAGASGHSRSRLWRLTRIAKGQGLMVPAYEPNHARPAVKNARPRDLRSPKPNNLQTRAFRDDREIRDIIASLEGVGISVPGRGETTIKDVAADPLRYEQIVRIECFRLALRSGNIVSAGWIAAPSKNSWYEKYGSRGSEDERVVSLPKKELLLFANEILRTFHEALPYLDHRTHRTLRIALRQLWKRWAIGTDRRDDMSFGETLIIHEVNRGLYHGTVDHSPQKQAIVWGTYSSLSDVQRELLYDHFAHRASQGPLDFGLYEKLASVSLDIPDDTVFASVSIRDGHELSILMCTQSGRASRFTIEAIDENNRNDSEVHWSSLVDSMVKRHTFWRQRREGQRDIGRIEWNRNFIGLGKQLLQRALQLNSQVRCIALATEAKLRGLPWQHLFAIMLRSYEHHLRARSGGAPHQARAGIVIQHVFGATQFIHDMRCPTEYRVGVNDKIDEDEHDFHPIATELKCHRDGWGTRVFEGVFNSLLTVLMHGRRRDNIFSRILDGNEPLTDDEHRDLSGYAVSLLHSCHAGYASDNPLGDIGGLPGFFMSHGSALIIAPVTAIAVDTVKVFDGHVTAWLRDPKKTFVEMYLTAIEERREISLYSVYGDHWKIDHLKRSRTMSNGERIRNR